MSASLKRLIKAFAKQGLSVTKIGSVYNITKNGGSKFPPVEILLPDNFELDGKAVGQLVSFAGVKHPVGGGVNAALATPDFHTGSVVPVGAVVSTTKDLIIPQAIGTDIHCGMRLHVADISLENWLENKSHLIEKLRGDLLLGTRDLPMSIACLRSLFEQGLWGWIDVSRRAPIGDLRYADFKQLEYELQSVFELGSEIGDIKWAPEHLVSNARDVIRDSSLATIGGGNHFVEFQAVDEILDKRQSFDWGIREGQLSIMIHTGSRVVGIHVGRYWCDKARKSWPEGEKYPDSGIFPLYGKLAHQYLYAMNTAANYANLNRLLLAEVVRRRVRQVFGAEVEMPLIYDAPHNIVTEESGSFIHRKGATPAHSGQPVLIPGSMGHSSYLMKGLGNQQFLCSASHGAGRAKPRGEMFRRNKAGEDIGLGCVDCITLKEERRIEEAPCAYKNIDEVIDIQMQNGIVSPVAKLRPLVTFKG